MILLRCCYIPAHGNGEFLSFASAWNLHADMITGSICGMHVETIELYARLGQRGIMAVGETDDAWIIKGFPNSDLDISVIVDKKTGKMFWFRVIDPEHRRIAETAKFIDIPEEYKVKE